jgi:membrane associated rhomboid family serine protease
VQRVANPWYLGVFGENVEDRMGHARYLAFYLLAGAAAGLAQAASSAGSYIPTVGASGAVAGVIGAYFVLYPRSRVLTLIPVFLVIQLVEIPAMWFLAFWFVVQFLGGIGSVAHTTASQGGMAFWAQAAGFASGLGGVLLFRRPERGRVEWWSE